MEQKNIKKKKSGYKYFMIALLVILAACLFYFGNVLGALSVLWKVSLPIVLGACIAFVANLPMSYIERKWLKSAWFKSHPLARRSCGLIITIILILLGLWLISWIVVPQLSRSVMTLVHNLPASFEAFKQSINTLMNTYPSIEPFLDNILNGTQNMSDTLSKFASTYLQQTVDFALDTVSGVMTFMIGLMFSIYILAGKETLGRQARQLIYATWSEKTADKILYFCHLTYSSFATFVTGQCLEAVILFSLYVVVALLFRLPYAFMIAVVIGVLALIPIFGAWIGWGIGVLLTLTVRPMDALTFTFIFIVVQFIETNFIYPKVVGKSVGLPGIWVLAAVTIGGDLMGLTGMIISVPLMSIIYTLLSQYSQGRLQHRTDEIDKVLETPDWSTYNVQTGYFEDHPVEKLNVFAGKGNETPEIPAAQPENDV